MTTTLGIASVTSVLQHILSNRLTGIVGGSVGVTTVAPDRVDLSEANDPNQVNIFLHRAIPNPGWANVDYPARDNHARRISTPPLVLDLHYLISVYSSAAFGPEILVGEIMQEFHERPVPARQVILDALNPNPAPAGFPAELRQSGLAEQIERIRITAETTSNEEMSKLWTAFQARYRMSLAYQVTTVIIESRAAARTALPVRRPLGNALSSNFPVVNDVVAASDRLAPIVAGTDIRIRGRQLGTSNLTILIDDVDVSAGLSRRRENQLDLTLPDPLPTGIYAGAVGVQVVQNVEYSDPAESRSAIASNTVVMVLRPQFTVTVNVDASEDTVVDGVTLRTGTFDLTLAPPIRRDQRLFVSLNGTADPWPAYTFRGPDGNGVAADASDRADVTVIFRRVAAGNYLIRTRVDAAESVLSVDAAGIYNGPTVTI